MYIWSYFWIGIFYLPEDPVNSTPDASDFFIFSRRLVLDNISICNMVLFLENFKRLISTQLGAKTQEIHFFEKKTWKRFKESSYSVYVPTYLCENGPSIFPKKEPWCTYYSGWVTQRKWKITILPGYCLRGLPVVTNQKIIHK